MRNTSAEHIKAMVRTRKPDIELQPKSTVRTLNVAWQTGGVHIKTVYLVNTVPDTEVPVEVVQTLEFAARVEQAGDDQMAEHVIVYPAVADTVVQYTVYQFRPDNPEL